MQTHNSNALLLDKPLLELVGLEEDANVEITVDHGNIIISPVSPETISEAKTKELMDKIIKTTIFLDTMDNFMEMNTVYEKILKGHKPARSTIEVGGLPKGALVEIECIAAIE